MNRARPNNRGNPDVPEFKERTSKGAPKGNKNAARGSAWRNALVKALDEYEGEGVTKGAALESLAMKVVGWALAGDVEFVHEIGNRLDGKPAQAIIHHQSDQQHPTEMSEADLERIAAGGSAGASPPPESADDSSSVH